MQNFIERHAVNNDSVQATHTSLARPRAKFAFKTTRDSDTFYHRLCETVRRNEPTFVAELPRAAMPIRIDIDLYINADGVEPDRLLYDTCHVAAVHQAMCAAMDEVLVDPTLVAPDAYTAIVLEKPPYVVSGKYKHGFHLHYANANTGLETCERVNIEYTKKLRSCPVFGELLASLGMDFDAAVDVGAVLRNPWLMYGASKGPDYAPYRATYALTKEGTAVPVESALGSVLRTARWPDGTLVDMRDDGTGDGHVLDVLPLLLSIHVHDRPLIVGKHADMGTPPTRMQRTQSGMSAPRFGSRVREYTDEEVETNIKTASQLVPLLSPTRAVGYTTWWTVGWLLHAVTAGHRRGYELFLDFSRSAGQAVFNETACERLWTAAHPTALNMGTLHYYVRNDSPDAYATWRREATRDAFTSPDAFTTHVSVAKLLHLLYADRYKCASISHKMWYEFTPQGWHQVDEGTALRAHISGELLQRLRAIRDDTIRTMRALGAANEMNMDGDEPAGNLEADEDPDDAARRVKQLAAVLRRLSKSEVDLQSTPFRNSVMTECMHLFYDATFLDRLDKDPFLFAFSNGVYDLSNCVFREATPDDYISRAAPVEYNTELTEDSPAVVEVKNFLLKIFPNAAVRQFFMDYYCDVFVGNNSHKYVMLWTGEGDNGKSMNQLLFEKALGKYVVKLPTSLLVGKRTQSSAACPELARAGNGARLAMIQEPDQRDTINIGCLKELSGNDTMFARALYSQGQEITPMFRLAIVCNQPPSLSYSDTATWNRLRVLPYMSKFTDDAPEDPIEQDRLYRYPKDVTLITKLDGMAEAFAWLLLHHRANVRGPLGAIHEPDEVKLATQQLKTQLDSYVQFETECTRATGRADDAIMLGRLYEEFKRWYRDSMPGQKLPNKPEVKQEFTRRWGAPDIDGHGWSGRRVYVYDPLQSGAAPQEE